MSPHDSPTTYRESLLKLASAQKPGRGSPPYSRYVNRRLGRYLAAFAHVRRWTPDGVTALSATMTASGLLLLCLARPTWWLGVVIAALLLLGYALDAADGQLARLRGGGSRAGEWLDHVVDATKIGLLHSAVLISWYRFEDVRSALLLVPLAFMTSAFVFFFGMILTDQLRRAAAAERGVAFAKPGGPGGAMQSVVAVPTDYGLLCAAFMLIGIWPLFAFVYTVLAGAQVLVTAAVLVRWWSQLRAVDRENSAAAVGGRGAAVE